MPDLCQAGMPGLRCRARLNDEVGQVADITNHCHPLPMFMP